MIEYGKTAGPAAGAEAEHIKRGRFLYGRQISDRRNTFLH